MDDVDGRSVHTRTSETRLHPFSASWLACPKGLPCSAFFNFYS